MTADSSLGRIELSLLSDQTLMELLFDGMKDDFKELIQDEHGNFKDISEWDYFIKFNDESVSEILITHKLYTDKQFPFECIPPRVIEFNAVHSNLHGTVDPSVLPLRLLCFQVPENKLHGSINLGEFPETLERLEIWKNAFCGNLDLSVLPAPIITFKASHNSFSGDVNLNNLPSAIQELNLNRNVLSGSVSIKNLPETITNLQMEGNMFEGDFELLEIPSSLEFLNIWCNQWDRKGKIVFPRQVRERKIHFELWSHCTAVVDECGNTHPWEKEILEDQRELDLC